MPRVADQPKRLPPRIQRRPHLLESLTIRRQRDMPQPRRSAVGEQRNLGAILPKEHRLLIRRHLSWMRPPQPEHLGVPPQRPFPITRGPRGMGEVGTLHENPI